MRERIFVRMSDTEKSRVVRNLEWLIERAKTSPYAIEQEMKARGIKINQPTIHRVLSGETKEPRGSTLQPLADYFGVTLSDLRDRDLFAGEAPDTTPSEDAFALVPELDVQAACGPGGKFTDHVVVKGGLAFKRSFLRELGLNEEQARVIHADGPSMEPTIGHGRVVLVNLADTAPKDGKVYLICDEDGGVALKRLVRDFDPAIGATVWKIRSDNTDKRKYPDKFWPEDSRAHIIGRAVWHDGLL